MKVSKRKGLGISATGKYSVHSDPRGLIFEAYQINGITSEDCRSIFFDWALGLDSNLDAATEITNLYTIYGETTPNHPMSAILREGLLNFNHKLGKRRRRRG